MVAASIEWFWNKPSWGWSEGWAAAILLVPSLLVRRQGTTFIGSLINGIDNRWSTSKAGIVLWTYGIVFAFVTILIHTAGSGLEDVKLSQQYLLLLGIPATGAVGASAITQSKIKTNSLTQPKTTEANPPKPIKGIGQLFSDDQGGADILDSQYFVFSLLLLGYFLTQFLTAESTTLPTLPDTLVGLTGVSAASYLAKKGVQNNP